MMIPGPRIRSQDIPRLRNKFPSQVIDQLNLCRIQQVAENALPQPGIKLSEESFIKEHADIVTDICASQ